MAYVPTLGRMNPTSWIFRYLQSLHEDWIAFWKNTR